MDYKTFLINKFNQDLSSTKPIYEKIDTPHIVVYQWIDGCAYRAPYRCLASGLNGLEVISEYIEQSFSITNKRGEYYLYINELHGDYNVPGMEIRVLDYSDEIILERLKSSCSIEEVELAQLTIHDIHPIGVFKDGLLVGCSSILELHGAYDIGILIHPEYRCRGLSTMLVAANTKWVLSQGHFCMYRCDDFNIASYKTAIKLGYIKFMDVVIYDIEEGK